MTPNRRIFFNIIATYGRSLYALVCGLFTARWVLEALGQVDFGLYGLVGGLTVFIGFFNMLLSVATSRFYAFSVGQAAKSAADGDKDAGIEECRKWFSTAVMLHTIVPCVLTVVGYPLGIYVVEHWLTIPSERLSACIWVFRFVCISCFIGMINVPFNAMYTAKQYIAELTVYSFFQTTANVGFVYFMVTHPGDWLAKYALWMCVVACLPQTIICLRALKVFPECRFKMEYAWSMSRTKQLSSFAFWQAFGGLGAIARGQGIQILINKYFGPSINASMSIANQVSAQTQTLAGALQGAFSPAITTACGAGEYDKMRSLAFRTCKFGMLLGLIFILPLALELDTVLKLWLKNPPPYTKELCWSILATAIIDKSSSGHMLAVTAKGKIAAYQAFLGTAIILTLPIAWVFVKFDLGVSSIGWAILIGTTLCAWGRVWFARSLVGMSARYWLFRLLAPVAITIVLTGLVGYLTRLFMTPGVCRVIVTTLLCELVLLPLSWFVLLDGNERQFVVNKVRRQKA